MSRQRPQESDRPTTSPHPGELIDVQPGRISFDSVSSDGLVLTIHLRCNVEQSLHHLDVEENDDVVRITAWYGWRPDAVHVRVPSAVAAGKSISPREVRLTTPLGHRSVIDGGTEEIRTPSKSTR